jgi:DNA-binding MarR family transcriptional regulator
VRLAANPAGAHHAVGRAEPASPASDGEELDDAITAVVRWAGHHELQARVMQRAHCDLPLSQVWLLARIVNCGPCHPSQLATQVGVDNSTITPKLQRLEAGRLVVREPDPSDGRAALVRATPTGVRLLQKLRRTRAAILDERLRAVPDERRRVIVTALGELAQLLDGGAGSPESGR